MDRLLSLTYNEVTCQSSLAWLVAAGHGQLSTPKGAEGSVADKEVILSREGLEKLEQELDFLKNVKRKEVAERIKQAREYGDISENSEYEDAKNEQAFIEGRILTLEKTLRHARVLVMESGPADVVTLGSRVKLKDIEYGDLEEYVIVGTLEANPNENKISNESPVGKAIMGQRVGCIVTVHAPAGALKYEIVEINR